jgi:hypothetical protein
VIIEGAAEMVSHLNEIINWKLFTLERRSTKQSRLGFGIGSVLVKREA